jgi:glutathione S-transferase
MGFILFAEVTKAFREEDETKKAEIKKNLKEVVLPRLLKKLDDILKQNGTGVLVGKDITYADIYVSFMTEFLAKFVEFDVDEYSNVVSLHKKINNSPGIKEWIAKRPDTQF